MISAVIVVSSAFLALASLEDLKTSEVPERYSVGLAAFNLALGLGHALVAGEISHIVQPLLMGALGLGVGYLLFVSGQWGGGDVKILAGIGCFIGYMDSTGYVWPRSTFAGFPIHPFVTYFIDMAFLATPYVVLYTVILGFMNPGVFKKYLQSVGTPKHLGALFVSFAPLVATYYVGMHRLSAIYSLVPLLALASLYMKTVEYEVLTKKVKVSELREWDIPAEDVVVAGEKIASKRNIEGITPEQLQRIRKESDAGRLPKTMKIKWGVKFVPILFLAYLATTYVGNILELVFDIILYVH